jgi:hypothetical protein
MAGCASRRGRRRLDETKASRSSGTDRQEYTVVASTARKPRLDGDRRHLRAQAASTQERTRAKADPARSRIRCSRRAKILQRFRMRIDLSYASFWRELWQLYRAVVRLGETFDHKTMLSWIQGDRVPRSVASFEILARIERRYRLPAGYFKAKLPHQSRSLLGHDLGDISPAERRRISLHLPDDFSSLPFSKREEILDWVRRVIISGSTEYRRYQAAASKQRYAIRFPGVTYGGGSPAPRVNSLTAGANNNVAANLRGPGSPVRRRRCATTARNGNGRPDPFQNLDTDGDWFPTEWGLGRGNGLSEDRASRLDVRRTSRLPCRRRQEVAAYRLAS